MEWLLGGGGLNFNITFLLDYLSCFFLGVVLCISSNVVWYRRRYMRSDLFANRFIMLVLGFVVSIVFLILSPNILSILLGWDGLGLISYCLVIYYPSKKSRSAGILTVLSNRVGDVCILLSIAWFGIVGDFNFLAWNLVTGIVDNFWAPILIMIAAITKRAQIPFSAWLPAAIAAPTPVSALVHSSTLVTAGVYLLIRFSFLLEPHWASVLIFLSVITIFISGIVAIYEYDLKKVIALSTLSQLGIMIFAISLGLYEVAFFHLLSHALFKALLFLCAGVLIHGGGGTQDIRYFGALTKSYPLISVCLNLANFSLCGIPFMAGFYSKDMIIELACQNSWDFFIVLIMFICLGLTVLYSTRLVFFRLVNSKNRVPAQSLCEEDWTLIGPIVVLSLASLVSGPSLRWVIFPFPSLILLPETLKLGATFSILFSISFIISVCVVTTTKINLSYLAGHTIGDIWFIPQLSGQKISVLGISKRSYPAKILDQGWLEYYTFFFSSHLPARFNSAIRKAQRNSLKVHFRVFILWTLLALTYLLCFYSLTSKHSTEDAGIISKFKNKLLELNSFLQWKCNVMWLYYSCKDTNGIKPLRVRVSSPPPTFISLVGIILF